MTNKLSEAIAEAESYTEFEEMTRGDIPNCWVTIMEAARTVEMLEALPEGTWKIVKINSSMMTPRIPLYEVVWDRGVATGKTLPEALRAAHDKIGGVG